MGITAVVMRGLRKLRGGGAPMRREVMTLAKKLITKISKPLSERTHSEKTSSRQLVNRGYARPAALGEGYFALPLTALYLVVMVSVIRNKEVHLEEAYCVRSAGSSYGCAGVRCYCRGPEHRTCPQQHSDGGYPRPCLRPSPAQRSSGYDSQVRQQRY